MPSNVEELVGILSPSAVGEGIYEGCQPEAPKLVRVFGGQVVAQALAAATLSVSAERPVHSLHAYFILGGDPGVPIRYEVNRTRDGGSFSARQITAIQHDRDICHVIASFHRSEPGFEHSFVPPRLTIDPEQLPTIVEMHSQYGGIDAEIWDREWGVLDMRVESAAEREGGVLGHRIWFKMRERIDLSQQLQRAVLAYISDLTLLGASLLPHGYFVGDPKVQRASLDHALWFHGDVDTSEWLIYDQISPWAGNGRGLVRAEIYTRSGRLVASVSQEGLIRPRDRGNGQIFRR